MEVEGARFLAIVNRDGDTAMHVAAARGHANILSYMADLPGLHANWFEIVNLAVGKLCCMTDARRY